MAEETAHGPSRRVDGRLAEAAQVEAVRVEPGTVRACHTAAEIGDGGDHRRPGLRRRTVVRAIVAARMKAQRARIVDSLDAAIAQIGLDERPADRLRHGDQPPRRFQRSGGDGCANGLWGAARFNAWQTEEAPRLVGNIAKVDETAALADDVEEIAIFSRGAIGPAPGGAGTGFRSVEPDEHRPAGGIANVAHRPVAALAPPVGKVMTAYRLGMAGEAARQFGSVTGHHATSRSAMRTTGWRSKSFARTPVPVASVGTRSAPASAARR